MLDICKIEAGHTCLTTINGWVWYCGEHETHGNADTQEEAEHLALSHVEFQQLIDEYAECCLHYSQRPMEM